MTKIDAPFVAEAGKVMAMLTEAGHQAWFVGGCVRNALLGAPVSDIDITTDARPDDVMTLAKSAGLKALPTGIDHGTVTVIDAGKPYEITTFRRDVDTDGRHATVQFSDTIAEDAARRDFTMNALYAGPDGTVADPLGGLADLQARHVRFIGDAEARIAEDYLRILRFFRFTAIYGNPDDGIDAEGLAACASGLDGLEHVSAERIGAEMRKLLGARDPAPSMASMRSCGALLRILPGAGTGLLTVLIHVERTAALAPDWLRRLAALGVDDATDALRLSRAESRQFEILRNGLQGTETPGELGYRRGGKLAVDILALRAAASERTLVHTVVAEALAGAEKSCPVTAKDLMPTLSGKALGDRLKQVESRWIASGFTLTKEALLK
ncbi:CCA tRNA nucleotidyltransferase [Flavimaricola marinus]|uniref:CCA-adding enzyme n=1 Tax=Flavimaricola marinus TaxID=1819565 RepID=A0A238LE09_9RHOB|nr:CCA tRNA nucleotidyltransferase [Flavimaricola marinus]SMY07170.1 CCA-adding enzyme [Flavimaricola marinus]